MNTMRRARGRERRAADYPRWLETWAAVLGALLRGELAAERLLWVQDEGADLLAAGFPGLVAVPERLFAEAAALFPERIRLAASGDEEQILSAIRALERRSGVRFDWDGFLARCEHRRRRAQKLSALAAAILRLAPRAPDPSSPAAALRELARNSF